MSHYSSALAGIAIGLALVVAAHLVSESVRDFRAAERHVSVRGLAERQVGADFATWSVYFTVIGEEFEVARVEGERQLDLVREFLEDHHLSMDEVVIEPMVVTDRMANPYESMQGGPRYRVRAGVSVRTSNVGAVKRAALDSNQLIRSGVLLEPNRPAYSFTSLNALKPEMLAEATAAARLAAEQFAKDSKSRVGSIRDANQGVFSIDDAYPGDPESGQGGTYATDKKVRVVSTISFYLE